MPSASPAPIRHRIEIADLHAHLFHVRLTIARPAAEQVVSLPVWIPGSYMVREFSGQLQGLQARQGRKPVAIEQLDKCSWQLQCTGTAALQIDYEVYANDPSVRAAMLSHERGFFNATSACLQVQGQHDGPQALEVVAPKGRADWLLATGLRPITTDRRGFGHYLAADYDELADCPVTLGRLWSGQFKACGVPHRFVISGAPEGFDGQRLLDDTRKICETQIRFWHASGKPPFKQYVFMLHAVADGYGGLEHRNSTALVCGRKDLPLIGQPKTAEGYTTLLGLISHEYFHTWNVKRLRPAEFARYDYSRENYTQLLWFFEGFTSYYDDLLLRRAGLIDSATYLKLLGKTINQVLQTPGRKVQSVAQASMDAWVKYYRQNENTPNATVSYYTKGALVALCLDLSLRAGRPASDLDALMRALWKHCKGGPMGQGDLLEQLQALGARSYRADLERWVHGTQDLPLKELLQTHGVAVLDEPDQLAQRLGLRVDESQGIKIKTVLSGGPAQTAGLSAGDEWLGIETAAGRGWRLRKLDDLLLHAQPGQALQALVSRDEQLVRLPLRMPKAGTTWRLAVQDAARLERWLAPDPS
jgi:predicted metalloprotease with PDZ domain